MLAVDTSIIIAQLSLVEVLGSTLIAGIFGIIQHRQEKKREAERKADLEYRNKREKQEETRQNRDAKLYGVVLSTARGTQVLLHQAHGDHLNGDVEHSLKSIEDSISEFNKLSNDQMSKL